MLKVSQKWAQGWQKWAQGCQKGAQGSQKGAQGEPKISSQIRVREPVRPLPSFWPQIGAIFDEKNDKKAMRSYTVFKYPKIDEFSMQKQSWN